MATEEDEREDERVRLELGAYIRHLRQARGMSLRALAERIDLSYPMLGHVEVRGQNTTIAVLQRILRELGGRFTFGEHRASTALTWRETVARRFGAVLPRIPDEELRVLEMQIALLERRYLPRDDE